MLNHRYLPTTSLSSSGTSLKILLKSSERDLYVGYKTLYQEDFFFGLSDVFGSLSLLLILPVLLSCEPDLLSSIKDGSGARGFRLFNSS